MRLRGWIGLACLAAVAVSAYAVWKPEAADRWAPRVAGIAHGFHDRVWTPETKDAGGKAKRAGPPPVSVTAVPVTRGDFPIVLQGLGQVQAYNTVTVRARVDGQIDKIAFTEGQMVTKGELLAEIDPRPFQATLEQAQAKKTQDDANLANARLDLDRYQTLAKQSFVTQQQLDTQKSTVSQLTAAIAADAATIDAATVQLGYTKITAPLSGRLGYRLVDQGNMVSASQQTGIVNIAQIEPISVTFTQPQDNVDKINAELKNGPLLTTVIDSKGEPIATGRLTVTDNQVDALSGTIKLKAEFDNKDRRLWPGLAVTVALQIGVAKNAILIPTQAVQHGEDNLFVYVVDDQNKVVLRKVKIAHQDAVETAIADGVKEGERVVTTGAFLIQPGALVAVQDARGS